jgi:ABC-type transporter Mla subunit MlaD
VRADPVVVRRIVGTASVVLLVALLTLALDVRFTTAGAYEVEAELGRAGTGLRNGSDVKLRGVNVGRVSEVRIDDRGEVTAILELHPEPRLPDDVVPVVTPKMIPVEPVAVIDQLGRLVRDVDDHKLAAFIDALAAFDHDDADLFAEGIDTGAELAAFLSRTAPDQIDRMGDAARAMDALADASGELTRLAEALPEGVAPLVDNREALRATVDSVGPFAATFGEFLRIEEETFGQLLAVGDEIGAIVDPRMHEIGSMIHGIYRYSLMFGQHGGHLDDGGEFALFRAFIGEEGQFLLLCEQLPPELAEVAPGCIGGGAS